MDDELDNRQTANPLSSPGSSYSMSTDPESSHFDAKRISVESKKRKARDEKIPRSRLKRLRGFYNDDYRNLLNTTIEEVTRKTALVQLKPLRANQLGMTKWSPEEKEIFFGALTSKGRDDHLGVAAMIGTKTELEVRVYLQLLQKATLEHHIHDRRRQLLSFSDVAGAYEVSKDCCDALDLAADALVVLQEKKEQSAAIEEYGELGLLNAQSALWVENNLDEDEDGESNVSQALPAAKILNLKSHLQLSARLFMNSNDPEYNWRSYSNRDESPSILYTAFSDIHNLAISVTRRLVQSALFFAMSRMKAMNSSNYTHRQHVRRRDVTAALNVLGLKLNARDYWVGVAKRCSLDVYEDLRRKSVEGKKLSYEEVEKTLSQPRKYKFKSGITTPQENNPSSTILIQENDLSASDYPSEDDTDVMSSQYDSDLTHTSGQSAQVRLEGDQDAYAEALDVQASQRAEQSLWKMLGKEASANLKSEEPEFPKRPGAVRKSREDLDEWRPWVDYVGEWEAYSTPVPASDFAANRRKFRDRNALTTSMRPVKRSRRAGGGNKVDEGSPGDHVVLEDAQMSEVSGDAYKTLPATHIEDHFDKRADDFEEQEDGTNKSDSSTYEDEDAGVDEKQEGTGSGCSSVSISEAEDQESVSYHAMEQDTDASDGSVDDGLKSSVNRSVHD